MLSNSVNSSIGQDRLIYDGPLKAAAGIDDKHALRKAFHDKFKTLWQQVPLADSPDLPDDPPKKNRISIITGFNNYKFAPWYAKDFI